MKVVQICHFFLLFCLDEYQLILNNNNIHTGTVLPQQVIKYQLALKAAIIVNMQNYCVHYCTISIPGYCTYYSSNN